MSSPHNLTVRLSTCSRPFLRLMMRMTPPLPGPPKRLHLANLGMSVPRGPVPLASRVPPLVRAVRRLPPHRWRWTISITLKLPQLHSLWTDEGQPAHQPKSATRPLTQLGLGHALKIRTFISHQKESREETFPLRHPNRRPLALPTTQRGIGTQTALTLKMTSTATSAGTKTNETARTRAKIRTVRNTGTRKTAETTRRDITSKRIRIEREAPKTNVKGKTRVIGTKLRIIDPIIIVQLFGVVIYKVSVWAWGLFRRAIRMHLGHLPGKKQRRWKRP